MSRHDGRAGSGKSTAGLTARIGALAFAEDGSVPSSPEILHFARRHLIDTVAAMLAGSRQAVAEQAEAVLRELRGNPSPRLGVAAPGRHWRGTILDAAYLGAVSGHGTELDDGYRPASLHPGTVVVPSVLALAATGRVSGRAVLDAVVAGYEAMGIIGRLAHPHLRQRGFHPTAAVGPFGAAIAAARIRGLGRNAVLRALGMAASSAGGLFAFLSGGADVKRLHPGHAAREGVAAVLLAEKGLSGPSTVLEGRDGFLQAFAGARGDDPPVGHEAPPEMPVITQCYMKPHACCRHIHPALDALLSLMVEHHIGSESIESVEIETYAIAAAHATVPWSEFAEAQLSFPFVVATAARFGRVGIEHFDAARLTDPATGALCSRVRVSSSERMDRLYLNNRPARVTVKAGGREYAAEVLEAFGSPDKPMSDRELGEKFMVLATPVLGADRAGAALTSLWQLHECDNVAEVVAGLSPVTFRDDAVPRKR